MTPIHKEILTEKQSKLLPLIKELGGKFGLVGGTAIALYIGHRQSIDFDLFSNQPIKTAAIRKKIIKFAKIQNVLVDKEEEFTVIVGGVKFTFLQFPFKLSFTNKLEGVIKLPDLLALAALKAYALSRRAKWKDYVDLYFIIKGRYNAAQISEKAKKIFGKEFNEKIFRSSLCYFKDIDYSEKVIFQKKYYTPDSAIKKALTGFSVE